MRKVYLILIVTFHFSCFSQNKELLYNFTSIPQSSLVNPGADVSYKFYFGFPVLSGVSANLGSSSFSAYDLFADNGVDFNDKVQNIINKSSAKDKTQVNQQLELFSGGFRIGGLDSKSYISFGAYQEFDFLMYIPKDPGILILDGNQNYIGKSFNLADINVRAEVLSVFHVGFHKKLNEKVVLGGRAKIYSSGANATSTRNSGFIYTEQSAGTPNIYTQVISSNLELKTSGLAAFTKDEYDGDIASDIAHNTFFNGSLGLGLDAGITYYFKENLQFTASIIDLGFIKQSKDIETITYKGNYSYNGVNPIFDGKDSEDVIDEFDRAIPRDTLYNKYTTWRPTKLYSSIQYSFGDSRSNADCNCRAPSGHRRYINAVGGQLFAMTMPNELFVAITAFYKRSILESLDFKATYTYDSYSSKNFGFGLSGTIGKFNMYALISNVLEYKDVSKANSLAFQFGINFIFQDSED